MFFSGHLEISAFQNSKVVNAENAYKPLTSSDNNKYTQILTYTFAQKVKFWLQNAIVAKSRTSTHKIEKIVLLF